MRPQMRMAGLLLAAALAVASQPIQLPSFSRSFVEPVPRLVLFSARESLAAINQFIIDGDVVVLWQTLDQVGHGLDPWPVSDPAERDQIALAFRDTFPDLKLDLVSLEPSAHGYKVQIEATGSAGSIPGWLGLGTPPVFSTVEVEVGSVDGVSIDRLATRPSPFPLVASAPYPRTPFLIVNPSRLFAARVTLAPSETHDRYLTVHAPALVAPQSAPLTLEGAERLFMLRSGSPGWATLLANEPTTLLPGDLLYLPTGYAVLTLTTPQPASFVLFGVAATAPSSRTVDEDGRPIPADLAQLASASDASPTSAWFGTVEPCLSGPIDSYIRALALVATWVVIPSGTDLAPAPGTAVACTVGEEPVAALPSPSNGDSNSPGNQPSILLVARLIPVGS